jgi:pimeloyl-ACP methyl ester carboxylesterase
VGGHAVHYRVVGEGDPLILVHGLSGSTRWWVRNIAALAAEYQVHLVDLPGFGAMRRLRRHFVLAEAASWLAAWMEAVGLKEANLVGHSMGGYVCLRLAAQRPEAVRRLVLVAPAGVPAGRSLFGHLVPLLLAARHMMPSFLPVLAYDAIRTGPVALWRVARELLAEDVREDLQYIDTPALMIWGEKDPLVPPSVGHLLQSEIAGSQLLVLQNAGHVPMFDRPQEFNAALLAFFSGGLLKD